MLGPAAAGQAAAHLGVHAAWRVWALGAWAVITVPMTSVARTPPAPAQVGATTGHLL
jgi:hypothetical protein